MKGCASKKDMKKMAKKMKKEDEKKDSKIYMKKPKGKKKK